MCFSQTPPPSPPSETRTIGEIGIAPKSGGVDKNPDKTQINSFTGNGTETGQNSSILPKKKRQRPEMEATPTAKDVAASVSAKDVAASASVSVEDVAASIPGAAEKVLRTGHTEPENIRAGTSRSDEIKLGFYRERFSKEDAQLLLQQKHSELVEKGYTTLIGKVAQRIDKEITTGNLNSARVEISETPRAAWKSFSSNGNRTDITSGHKTYSSIISDMYDAGKCSPRTAFYILKNLSKGYAGKRDYELFLNLDPEVEDLMAVLICEAIRFQEDGALARMAIRKVLSLFPKPLISDTSRGPVAEDYSDVQPAGRIDNNPFYKVFVSIEETTLAETTPFAIFAATQDEKRVGGKRRKLDLIERKISAGNTHYKFDQNRLFDTVDCLSDSEEQKEKKDTGSSQTKSEPPHTPPKNHRRTSSGREVITPKKFQGTP